jgi:hypothetical protein
MICKMIDELSINYLDQEMSPYDTDKFQKHIRKCPKCRVKFNIIKNNYKTEGYNKPKMISIADQVMKKIDKDLYAANKGKALKKRLAVVVVCILILVTGTVYAEDIYKTYQELASRMFVDRERLGISVRNRIANGSLEEEEYVEKIYQQYAQQAEQQAKALKTGDILKLSYEESEGTFQINIARGEAGNFVSYGFKDHKLFFNDYAKAYEQQLFEHAISRTNKEYYSSEEALIDTGEITAIPGYLPKGYKLSECFRSFVSDSGHGQIGLRYELDEKNRVSLLFLSGKMGEGPNGPGELIYINGKQAFYSEHLNNGIASRIISIYLGDGLRFPTLNIYSDNLDKDELQKIAESIKLYNEDANLLENGPDYFVGIKDARILEHADDYINSLRKGSIEFSFKIDKNIEFFKRSSNDTYYIQYNNVNYNDIKELLYLPVKLDSKILDEYKLRRVQVLGKPYARQKEEFYQFEKGKSNITLMTEKIGSGQFDNMKDTLIYNVFSVLDKNDYKPVTDDNGHLYYYLEL